MYILVRIFCRQIYWYFIVHARTRTNKIIKFRLLSLLKFYSYIFSFYVNCLILIKIKYVSFVINIFATNNEINMLFLTIKIINWYQLLKQSQIHTLMERIGYLIFKLFIILPIYKYIDLICIIFLTIFFSAKIKYSACVSI